MAVDYVKTYANTMADAQRQQRLAEYLQKQAEQPLDMPTYQGFAAMPSYAAGLAKILSAYGARKAGEQAEESQKLAKKIGREEVRDYMAAFEPTERKVGTALDVAAARPEDQRTATMLPQNLDMGEIARSIGAPTAGVAPQGTGPQFQAPQFEVGGAPMSAGQRRAKLLEGMFSGNPMIEGMAQAEYYKKPEVEKFGQTPQYDQSGRAYVLGEGGSIRYLPGITKDKGPRTITKEVDLGNKVLVQYSDGTIEEKSKGISPSREPSELYKVTGPDGKPMYTTRGEAIGKTAYEKPPEVTGDDKVDRRQYRQSALGLQNAMDAITGFAAKLAATPKEESVMGGKAGELSAAYKLALGAVRELQATGVLNPGELPFLEDTLKDPQKLAQLVNPQSRDAITGQINAIVSLLQQRKTRLDKTYNYDARPLETPEGFGVPKTLPPGAIRDRKPG